MKLWAALLFLFPSAVHAQQHNATSMYGTPGLIDTPTATGAADGDFALTSSYYKGTFRNTLNFQISPRINGSFRYAIIDDRIAPGEAQYDRSFDIEFRLLDEGRINPAIAVGFRDFGGTGVFASEYFVATKEVSQGLKISGGLGFGRLGSYNGFSNPFGLGDRTNIKSIEETGRIATGNFFRGPAAFFGGVEWRYSEQLVFKAEYSSDAYVTETDRLGFVRKSPFNFGATYQFKNGTDVSIYSLYGSEIGLSLSYSFNPATPRVLTGTENAPLPIVPRNMVAAKSWDSVLAANAPSSAAQRPTQQFTRLPKSIEGAFDNQGLRALALNVEGDTATLHIENKTFDAAPQALGRAARLMANHLPREVEVFRIIPVSNGLSLSAITLRRSDLEELEFDVDGSWRSYVRADIADGIDDPLLKSASFEGLYPKFTWGAGAYLVPALFDPDAPVRADAGLQLNAAYTTKPGVIFSGQLRVPVVGNLNESTRDSNSILPHVRSDGNLYDINSTTEISYLTGEYFFRPREDLFGRVTAGYLERMYGGVSGELLWKPATSRLALGAEINYVRQREFDVLFDFRDYSVFTGHASAYYDFGGGYMGQIDVGRYLAKDYGATFTLNREFSNGFKIGAFFTLTDVSFDDFGEGSFDKGIILEVPVSWLSGRPSLNGFGTVIRPVSRDGGARLEVRNRLYDITRNFHDPELRERWGRFWR